jgi:PTH1 family peptidyl-tRNA hydrolase
MKVLVGLGNPGPRYRYTRHNVGFMALDRIAERTGFEFAREKFDGLVAEGVWQGEKVLMLKPKTFMNLSGNAVAKATRNAMEELTSLLVISDEVQLPLGKLRMRAGGSAGGHNGLKSIVEALGTQEFPRLRMGVGESASAAPLRDHVLSTFRPDERETLEDMIERAAKAALMFVSDGLDKAMTAYN